MFIKLFKRKIVIFIALIELLLLVFFNIVNFLVEKNFNYIMINIRFTLLLLCINLIILTNKLKNKKLFIGLFSIGVTLLYYLFELYFSKLSSYKLPIYSLILIALVLMMLGINDVHNERLSFIKKIKNLTFYDPVTGLPSKNIILKTCPIKIIINCRNKKCHYFEGNKKILNKQITAVMLIDIDDFKMINDNLGSKYGDILLKLVAERLKTLVRENDIIIRHSADEFLLIINDIQYENDVAKITERVLSRIRQPFILPNNKVNITCSIGLALIPQHGDYIDDIIEKADIAMNKAKKEGKNQYFIFNNDLKDSFISLYERIHELKSAVKNDEFVVHYQPKAYTESNIIFGLEALVRWNHPKLGIIYPNDFVPLAEEIGVIRDIDLIVLKKVCKQIDDWINDNKLPYNITVNISPIFFMDDDFIEKIDETLSNFKLDPSYLGIEITETVGIKNYEDTRKKIDELKTRKITVYLDDFGKGYSSLCYLKHFPVDYLKIDKNFIDGINVNRIDEEIITYINNICSMLGIKVISEGIETIEQLNFIRDKGCHGYQGYLLSKPKDINELNLY